MNSVTSPVVSLEGRKQSYANTRLRHWHLANFFVTQFIVGAEQEARRQGYSFIVVALKTRAKMSPASLLCCSKNRSMAFCWQHLNSNLARKFPEILLNKLPVVSIHRVEEDFTSIVNSDQVAIGTQAVEHLIGGGRSHIATITGNLNRLSAQDRLLGTQNALRAHGFDSALSEEANWDPESGYEAAMRLLKRAPETDGILSERSDGDGCAARHLRSRSERPR